MIAELAGQELLTDVASVTAAVLVITGAAAAATRLPPVRWLGHTLFVAPFTAWLGRELREAVEPIVAQLQPNGGSSTRDAIDRVERRLDELADEIGPVLRDWRVSHPEMRPDDDGGSP